MHWQCVLFFQHHLAWSLIVPCWNPCVGGHIFSQVEDVGLSHPPGPPVDFLVFVRLWTCAACLLTFLPVLTVRLQVLLSSDEFSGAMVIAYNWQIPQNNVFTFGYPVAWSNGVEWRMVVDVLREYGPLFFLLASILCIIVCLQWIWLISFSRNVSECLLRTLKILNDHMSFMHAVQNLTLTAVHKWRTAVNWRDYAQRGVSPFLNGKSWLVKRRLSPPCFKRRLQPWPPCVAKARPHPLSPDPLMHNLGQPCTALHSPA